MLINNNGINSNNLSNNQVKSTADSNDKPNKSLPTATNDSVNLSANAQGLARLETAVMTSADVDSNRVDAIREAIDSGTYSIDAQAIATKLLDSDSII